jgi:hypothetical protein
MKIVLTIDVPEGNEEGILEELELDIVDKIQCGQTEGEAGSRCNPNYPTGTWKLTKED